MGKRKKSKNAMPRDTTANKAELSIGGTDQQILDDMNAIVLDDLVNCNTSCKDSGGFKTTLPKQLHIEDALCWLYENVPTLPYIIQRIVDFVFSDGLTTGDIDQDEKLDEWLFAKNINGVTNNSILTESIKEALIYGKNGIRWLGDKDGEGIINVASKRFAPLTEENTEYYGFNNTIGYIMSMDDRKMWETDVKAIKFDRGLFESRGIIADTDKRILILSKEELLSLRYDPTTDDGNSPLRRDKLRVKLLCAVFERLNYDIEYDGPGRIILRLKEGWASGSDGEASTSEVLRNQTKSEREKRIRAAKNEVEQLGKQIKESSSDSVLLLSNLFDSDIEKLPRNTQAIDFMDWLSTAGEIICQVYGIPPVLFNLGDISGNVSMEALIDNAMVNAIIPIRERFATQISTFVAPKIGVEKIYFDKYKMKQAEDENDKRAKVVDQIDKLRKTGNSKDNSIADRLADILDADLVGADNQNVKLSIFQKISKKIKGE